MEKMTLFFLYTNLLPTSPLQISFFLGYKVFAHCGKPEYKKIKIALLKIQITFYLQFMIRFIHSFNQTF